MNNGIHKTNLAAFGKAFQTNCFLTHLTLAKLERLFDHHTAIKFSCELSWPFLRTEMTVLRTL